MLFGYCNNHHFCRWFGSDLIFRLELMSHVNINPPTSFTCSKSCLDMLWLLSEMTFSIYRVYTVQIYKIYLYYIDFYRLL